MKKYVAGLIAIMNLVVLLVLFFANILHAEVANPVRGPKDWYLPQNYPQKVVIYSTETPTPTRTSTPTPTFPAGTNTPTPLPTNTPTSTPTPVGNSFNVTSSSSAGQTIASAVPGYYNTLRKIKVTNSSASTAGSVYVTDGAVTIWGPHTIGGGNLGINDQTSTYSAAMNRPLILFNSAPVTSIEWSGQYSIDLPGGQIR